MSAATSSPTTFEAGVNWVPTYPRIAAAVHGHTVTADRFAPVPITVWSGSITAQGATRHVTAPDEQTLRAGIVAETALIARAMRRPIRLTATTPDGSALLAVHPDGYVEPLPESGELGAAPTAAARLAAKWQARCRNCRNLIRVGGRFCSQCQIEHPLQLPVTTETPAADTAAPLGVEVFTTAGDITATGWLPATEESGPVAVTELAVPARPVSPVRGLDLPGGRSTRGTRPLVDVTTVVVVGAHGGAGETTVAALLDGSAEGQRSWPVSPAGTRPPVLRRPWS